MATTTRSNRKHFIAGAAGTFASIAFVRAPASAAQFTFKWAHAVQLNHPLHVNAVLVKNAVAKRSGGRLAIDIYPNNVLGGDPAMLSQVRSGAIQIYSGYGGIYAAVAPLAGIEGIGFAFRDQPQALAAFDGQLGELVRADMDAKGPFHTFARPWVNGFRQVTTSTKPIRVVADMHGLTLRPPPTHIWTDMFSALGAAPTPIAASEMYTALQTHVVDAQENPFTILETYRLFEVQKYISVTNHMWSNFWVVANAQAWQSLPPDLQTILREEIDAKAISNRRDMVLSEASLADKLVRRGMILNRVETAPFRAKLASAGFYANEKAAFGNEAWTALEKSVGHLG